MTNIGIVVIDLCMTTATVNLSVDQSHGTQLMISSSTAKDNKPKHSSDHKQGEITNWSMLLFSVAVQQLLTHEKLLWFVQVWREKIFIIFWLMWNGHWYTYFWLFHKLERILYLMQMSAPINSPTGLATIFDHICWRLLFFFLQLHRLLPILLISRELIPLH